MGKKKLSLSTRHGGHHVGVLQRHYHRLLHHPHRVAGRPVRRHLLPHKHQQTSLAEVSSTHQHQQMPIADINPTILHQMGMGREKGPLEHEEKGPLEHEDYLLCFYVVELICLFSPLHTTDHFVSPVPDSLSITLFVSPVIFGYSLRRLSLSPAGSSICITLRSTPTTTASTASTAAWLWSPPGSSYRWEGLEERNWLEKINSLKL